MLNFTKLIRKTILAIGDEPLLSSTPETLPFQTIDYDMPGRFAVGISSDGNTAWMVSGITGKPDNDTHYVFVEVFQYINVNYSHENVTVIEDKPANISYKDDLIKNTNILINTVPCKFAPGFLPENIEVHNPETLQNEETYTLVCSGSFGSLINPSDDARTFRSATSASNSSRLSFVGAYAARVPDKEKSDTSKKWLAKNATTMLYSFALWQY